VKGTTRHKHLFIIAEEESPRVPRCGWAEMIRKGKCSEFSGIRYVSPLIDSLLCSQCSGQMRIIAFITD
jgi:hypothetical protein